MFNPSAGFLLFYVFTRNHLPYLSVRSRFRRNSSLKAACDISIACFGRERTSSTPTHVVPGMCVCPAAHTTTTSTQQLLLLLIGCLRKTNFWVVLDPNAVHQTKPGSGLELLARTQNDNFGFQLEIKFEKFGTQQQITNNKRKARKFGTPTASCEMLLAAAAAWPTTVCVFCAL